MHSLNLFCLKTSHTWTLTRGKSCNTVLLLVHTRNSPAPPCLFLMCHPPNGLKPYNSFILWNLSSYIHTYTSSSSSSYESDTIHHENVTVMNFHRLWQYFAWWCRVHLVNYTYSDSQFNLHYSFMRILIIIIIINVLLSLYFFFSIIGQPATKKLQTWCNNQYQLLLFLLLLSCYVMFLPST